MNSSKANAFLRYFAIVLITGQTGFAGNILPPFLDHLNYPVSLLGMLLSVSSISSFFARLPAGVVYRPESAKRWIAVGLTVVACANLLYPFAVHPVAFALVQTMQGFAYGALTTMYLALFIDGLDVLSSRHHAMGYYTGCLAVGHSLGSVCSGYVADHLGYKLTFFMGAVVALAAAGIILALSSPRPRSVPADPAAARAEAARKRFRLSLLADPKITLLVLVAMFLNLLLQLGNAFFPLYGLAVGLNLTQIGFIKSSFSLCNAVTRPLTGGVIRKVGHQRLSSFGIALQAVFLTLISLFTDMTWLLLLFLLAGFFRAIVMVANTISVIEDVDEERVGRGVASGLLHGAGDLGSILGPSVGGGIAHVVGVRSVFFVAPPLMTLVFFVLLAASHALWNRRATVRATAR